MGQMLAGGITHLLFLFSNYVYTLRLVYAGNQSPRHLAPGYSRKLSLHVQTDQWHNKKAALAHRLFYLDPG